MLKRISIFLIFILLPVIAIAGNKFNAKIAVVDVESILEHSVAVQTIRKSINVIGDEIQVQMSDKEQQLKEAEQELIKQRGVLSKGDFEKKVAEFNKKVSEAQKETQQRKIALEHAHAKAIATVHNTTIEVISEMAKEHGFNLVLPSTQVLFTSNELNITLEVITKLNERLKEVKIEQ